MDPKRFFEDFQDHLAPKLDTYEQAIYLYVVRHSRLQGLDDVVVGFKSARRRMAMGVGEAGKPMSEGSAYKKLQSLVTKGCIVMGDSLRDGTRLRARLPAEIPGIVPPPGVPREPKSLDDLDFFEEEELRDAIFVREAGQCFYCLRKLGPDSWVIEHVRSRPEGSNGFRNVVAACRGCNNRKGSSPARDFVRSLYRDGQLNEDELRHRMANLDRLEAGELRPEVAAEYLLL